MCWTVWHCTVWHVACTGILSKHSQEQSFPFPVCCSVLQFIALHCSVLCVSFSFSMFQYVIWCMHRSFMSTQPIAIFFLSSVLHCVAVSCSMLQCVTRRLHRSLISTQPMAIFPTACDYSISEGVQGQSFQRPNVCCHILAEEDVLSNMTTHICRYFISTQPRAMFLTARAYNILTLRVSKDRTQSILILAVPAGA